MHRIAPSFLVLLLTAGCLHDASSETPLEVSVAELRAAPADFDGLSVTVSGDVGLFLMVNAAGCLGRDPAEPCNNGTAAFTVDGMRVLADTSYQPPFWAEGYLPQGIHWEGDAPVGLGCHGNDVEMVCTPGIPANIRSITATFDAEEMRLLATEVEVEEGAGTTTQTLSGVRLF